MGPVHGAPPGLDVLLLGRRARPGHGARQAGVRPHGPGDRPRPARPGRVRARGAARAAHRSAGRPPRPPAAGCDRLADRGGRRAPAHPVHLHRSDRRRTHLRCRRRVRRRPGLRRPGRAGPAGRRRHAGPPAVARRPLVGGVPAGLRRRPRARRDALRRRTASAVLRGDVAVPRLVRPDPRRAGPAPGRAGAGGGGGQRRVADGAPAAARRHGGPPVRAPPADPARGHLPRPVRRALRGRGRAAARHRRGPPRRRRGRLRLAPGRGGHRRRRGHPVPGPPTDHPPRRPHAADRRRGVRHRHDRPRADPQLRRRLRRAARPRRRGRAERVHPLDPRAAGDATGDAWAGPRRGDRVHRGLERARRLRVRRRRAAPRSRGRGGAGRGGDDRHRRAVVDAVPGAAEGRPLPAGPAGGRGRGRDDRLGAALAGGATST